MSYKVEMKDHDQVCDANQMKIGQIGVGMGLMKGTLLLRTFSGFIDLLNPRSTWTGQNLHFTEEVKILPPGSVIMITVLDDSEFEPRV